MGHSVILSAPVPRICWMTGENEGGWGGVGGGVILGEEAQSKGDPGA